MSSGLSGLRWISDLNHPHFLYNGNTEEMMIIIFQSFLNRTNIIIDRKQQVQGLFKTYIFILLLIVYTGSIFCWRSPCGVLASSMDCHMALGKVLIPLFPKVWVKQYNYCSFSGIVLPLNNPRRLICHCYGDISYHIPKMDSSNLNILARSGKTISRFLRDIWQTDCKPRTAGTSFVWLPFSANTITFTYHSLLELIFHRSNLKTTTTIKQRNQTILCYSVDL